MKLINALLLLLLVVFMPNVWAFCEGVEDYTEINGPYVLAQNDSSSGSISATGSATTGRSSTLQGALCAIGWVSIGKYASVQRLIDSSSSVTLAEGATVGGSISAIGEVSLDKYVIVKENITSDSSVSLQESSKVEGYISATGVVSLAKYVTVGESITSESSVTVGESSKIEGYISATGEVSLAKYVTVTESITSESSVTLQDSSKVEGYISATGEVSLAKDVQVGEGITSESSVTLGKNVKVQGDISAEDSVILGQNAIAHNISTEGSVILGQGATVESNITANGSVTLEKNATVEGDISTNGAVILGQNATVEGDISTNGAVTLGQNAEVGSNISADGSVTLGKNANVIGSISTNGSVILGQNATVQGNICAKEGVFYGGELIAVGTGEFCVEVYNYSLLINTSADALTCEAHEVSINVTNDNMDVKDYEGTISIATSSDIGEWLIGSGHGTLTAVDGDIIGQAEYTFSATDKGSVTLGLFNNLGGELTVTVTGDGTASTTELITFRPFQLKAELSCNSTIEANCINIANRPFDLKLTAVGEDASTGACQIIKEYTGSKNLKFWSSYLNPETPHGKSVEVNQIPIKKSATDAVEQAVIFENGQTPLLSLSINYPDAGQIQVHARDDAGIGAPSEGLAKEDELQGSVITIVNPFKLLISDISDNPAEGSNFDPTSNIDSEGHVQNNGFMRAAVRAYNTQDDDGNIVIADVDVDVFAISIKAIIDCSEDYTDHCSSAGDEEVAPSFENDVTLLPTLIFPTHASAAVGTVHSEDGANKLTKTMSAGELTYSNLSYDEVGVLGLQATSVNYIVPDNNVTDSDVKSIGRFYPAYIAYGFYSFSEGCNDFTYMTEGLSIDMPRAGSAVSINYVMQAKTQATHGATEQVTKNYDDSLGYPVAPTDDFSDSAHSHSGLIDLSNRVLPTSYYDESNWVDGIYMITDLEIGLQKSSSSIDGPYFSVMPTDASINDQLDYYIQLTGIDGEKLQTDAETDCTTDQCRLPADTDLSSLGDFAYGRLQAGNGHGSEYQPIRTLIEAIYFNGSEFVPLTNDNCTPLLDAQLSTTPTMSSSDGVTVGTSTSTLSFLNDILTSGQGYLQFSAPDSRGELDYFIRLKDASDNSLYTPWLLDNGNTVTCPDDAGGLTECISGHVEFGLFRGNDRIIYRLQTFN